MFRRGSVFSLFLPFPDLNIRLMLLLQPQRRVLLLELSWRNWAKSFHLSQGCCVRSRFSHVWLFAAVLTVAHQAPRSLGFSRWEYRSGLSCPPPGDLPDLRTERRRENKSQIYLPKRFQISRLRHGELQFKSEFGNEEFTIWATVSSRSCLCWLYRASGVSASTSVLTMNIQDWFPLGWTGLISLQSTELSKVFSNTTVQKHQFFYTQLSL